MTQEIEGWLYMDVAHIRLVHHDPCEYKVKGFRAVSSIERNISKRHLQEVQQVLSFFFEYINWSFH